MPCSNCRATNFPTSFLLAESSSLAPVSALAFFAFFGLLPRGFPADARLLGVALDAFVDLAAALVVLEALGPAAALDAFVVPGALDGEAAPFAARSFLVPGFPPSKSLGGERKRGRGEGGEGVLAWIG